MSGGLPCPTIKLIALLFHYFHIAAHHNIQSTHLNDTHPGWEGIVKSCEEVCGLWMNAEIFIIQDIRLSGG